MTALPSRVTLPSGTVLHLRAPRDGGGAEASTPPAPLVRAKGAPLFDEVMRAVASRRVLVEKSARERPRERQAVDAEALEALPLRDFHVLRAVLLRSAILAEEEITITCRNCGAAMTTKPCAALEIGHWVDGEAHDDELDVTLPFGVPIDVLPLPRGRVRTARTVTFEDRTARQARALFVAASRPRLDVDVAFVRAMGIVALGAEHAPAKIAEALAQCDDEAFGAVGDAFVDSHYVARLGAAVFCDACGARNDVDAPYERECGGGGGGGSGSGSGSGSERGDEREREREGGGLPAFEGFAARAREIGEPMLAEIPGEAVELVIEGGTPDVDDGGEPLLGSYVPPHPGDAGAPTRPPRVTVYYRTFRAMWDEEGPYDWNAELTETIEHELEHHVSFLRGDDPTDDEERAVIRDEAMRIVGKREASRRAMEGFAASWRDFLRRTWPIWALALLALAFMLATQR